MITTPQTNPADVIDANALAAATTKKKYRPAPATRTVLGPDDLLEVEEILTLTGWSIDTLNRRIAAGEYPRPIVGGGKRTDRKWARKQHTKWVDRKIAEAAKHD